MDNKLSELSKPVAWVTMQPEFCDDERTVSTNKIEADKYSLHCYDLTPLYSQEYVSALLQDISNLEQAMRHIHGAALDITVPRLAIAKAAEFATKKENRNG